MSDDAKDCIKTWGLCVLSSILLFGLPILVAYSVSVSMH